MDIMNNMTVSTSKLTFSLIAITALLVSGSAFLDQDAFGAATTFIAIHNSTTQTEIIFSTAINGTLNNQNWYVNGIMATGASNGTTPAHTNNNYASTTDGFLNNTKHIVLTHAALADTGATYDVRYITNGNYGTQGVNADIVAANVGNLKAGGYVGSEATIGTTLPMVLANNTAALYVKDGIAPTITKAVVLGPKTIEITFSEAVGNQNATADSFTLTGTDAVITTVTRVHNGTQTMLLGVQNPIDWRDTFTLNFAMEDGPNVRYLTDATNSPFHGNEGHNGTKFGGDYLGNDVVQAAAGSYGILAGGNDGKTSVGNNLLNFTGLAITQNVLNSLSSENCFDCISPTITNVQLSTPNSNPMDISYDDAVDVTAEVGDTITISVTYDDNKGAASLPFAGIYTNFVDTPEISNLYYKNNFDGLLQMSTSYYEWNIRGDDVAYDNDGVITWDVASSEIIADTQRATLTYTMTINEHFNSSQVWIDAADASGNYIKTQLPISIGTAGEASLSFASNGNQKVTSFFNENILLAIVSQWSTSSDTTANTAELSSVLGIENTALPEWTTSLATWAADDKIDVADMVIAVEYIINQ
jgi:hypothetical protein